jgi:hypothetical protein
VFNQRATMDIAAGMQLARAGVTWDAVKVSRFLGLQALQHIEHPGAVAVDPHSPEPMLYFFVPAGTTACWDVPDTTPLHGTEGTVHVVLPPPHREAPPGPYWLLPPSNGLTRTATLQRALETALARRDSSPRLRSGLDAARADAARILGDDAELPETVLLPQLIHTLRGHLMVLIPHVEDLSQAPSCAPGPRSAALAGVDEARRRLDAAPRPDLHQRDQARPGPGTFGRGTLPARPASPDHKRRVVASAASSGFQHTLE